MHPSTLSHPESPALASRLLELWERTGDAALRQVANQQPPIPGSSMATEQDRSDWTTTCLMNAYKNTGDSAVFALLFELSRASFLQAIQSQLRRGHAHIDAQDVLQEVFLNIYRYPHRFLADRADAFRNWGHRIVRNTLLKFLRGEARLMQQLTVDDEHPLPEDVRARSPERAAVERESAVQVDQAYLLYLNLYLLHFESLSAKEQRALTLVEVDGWSYRAAADDLGIRLENLKMVIFRGRRKIFRGMAESLAAMSVPADVDAN